jgi:DNA-binding response OmpR family regulator
MRLLLIEDTPRLVELLSETIREAGWRVDAVGTITDAEAAIALHEHDLILVDLGLPDGDGLDLIRRMRRSGDRTPVLILTARGAVEERIAGLDAGADDYLVKPLHHQEFLARCRAMLRRPASVLQPILEVGNLTYDPATACFSCAGLPLALPPRERALAEILIREAGRVVQRRRLETALSEFGEELSDNAIDLAVSRLRKKIDPLTAGASLETIRGVGYLLRPTAG